MISLPIKVSLKVIYATCYIIERPLIDMEFICSKLHGFLKFKYRRNSKPFQYCKFIKYG